MEVCVCMWYWQPKSKYMVRNHQDGYPYLNLNFKLFFVENIYIFLIKLIVQWTFDGDGQGIARDIKKSIFIFKTQQKMVTKFGQYKKLKCRVGYQLCKWSQFCFHFLLSFENDFFFNIPSNPPPIAVRNSLTNQFYQKNLCFCIFSKKKKKVTSLNRDIHPGDSWPYIGLLTSCLVWGKRGGRRFQRFVGHHLCGIRKLCQVWKTKYGWKVLRTNSTKKHWKQIRKTCSFCGGGAALFCC